MMLIEAVCAVAVWALTSVGRLLLLLSWVAPDAPAAEQLLDFFTEPASVEHPRPATTPGASLLLKLWRGVGVGPRDHIRFIARVPEASHFADRPAEAVIVVGGSRPGSRRCGIFETHARRCRITSSGARAGGSSASGWC